MKEEMVVLLSGFGGTRLFKEEVLARENDVSDLPGS
jgi:hypothetical protein